MTMGVLSLLLGALSMIGRYFGKEGCHCPKFVRVFVIRCRQTLAYNEVKFRLLCQRQIICLNKWPCS